MKLILYSNHDLRLDSTGVYFVKAFERLLGKENVTHLQDDSQLFDCESGDADYFLKVDDGQKFARWNPELKPSGYYMIDTHIDHLDGSWRKKVVRESNFDDLFFAQRIGTEDPDWAVPKERRFWVPLGADSEVHSPSQIWPKKYDVCFIGNFHTDYCVRRLDYCNALFQNFPNFYFGRKTFQDMADKFSQSKIVFNCSLNKDLNMRFFEATQSGSLLLTDSDTKDDAAELGYKDGVHYIAYHNQEDMLDEAAYYVKNDLQRESIASAGRGLTTQCGQYLNRAREIWNKRTKNLVKECVGG